MRMDKFTTRLQQALADAQSIAVGRDQQYIEPLHLLSALLSQDEAAASLLSRAGVAVPRLKDALAKAIERLPRVEGHGGEVQLGRELSNLLNIADRVRALNGTFALESTPGQGTAATVRVLLAPTT